MGVGAVVAAEAAAAGGDKIEQDDGGGAGKFLARLGGGLGKILAGAKEQVVKAFQFEAILGADLGAAQADDVETAEAVDGAHNGERGHVLGDARAALHDGEGADADELMDHSVAGEEGAVAHLGVTAEHGAIGHDDAAAQAGIVADVRAGHEEIVRGNDGGFLGFGGAMDGDAFAKDVALADEEAGRAAFIFDILGGVADDAAGVEKVVGADGGVAGEIGVGADAAARAEGNMGVDDGIGEDLDGGIELGFRTNDGRWMDHANGIIRGTTRGRRQAPGRKAKKTLRRALQRSAASLSGSSWIEMRSADASRA